MRLVRGTDYLFPLRAGEGLDEFPWHLHLKYLGVKRQGFVIYPPLLTTEKSCLGFQGSILHKQICDTG
jgi:hypothetical protein